jgi:uncharacterized protein (TIGR02302 family)
MTDLNRHPALLRLRGPLRLTLAGLWAERITRAFWPLWTVLMALLAALAFDAHNRLGIEVVWAGLVATVLGLVYAGWYAWQQFRKPTEAEAMARLDSRLPGRPIAALQDTQAIGVGDAASQAVWQAHVQRMAAKAAQAKAVEPDLRIAARDPFALRYVALTALVMAVLFGSLWRVTSAGAALPGSGVAAVTGPTWEGWAQPPAYTGKPSLYLNDVAQGDLSLPAGTRLQFRLYGEVGQLTLSETVSGRTEVPPASDPQHDFVAVQSGEIAIAGPNGKTWKIAIIADAPPTIAPDGEITRKGTGEFTQAFKATDDYGVVAGQVTIALDLAAVDRRYGLSVEPEAREPVVLDLPLPVTGDRAEFTETLIDDLSEHPFANLPVTMTYQATDAANQMGAAAPAAVVLPGKRFFDPFAAALIEVRRDLLWSRANAPLSVQYLKAITNRPEALIRNERAYLRLRVALRRLDAEKRDLTAEARDEIAAELWDIALLVEEGDLASALARLQRAQDRLDEAIRNGASPEEIDRLMEEMQQALDEYINQLAREAEQNPDGQMSQNQQGQAMSGDQLQQMLDELQRLMEEGKTAEAAELMEQLREFMENMQVVQGQGGGGQGGPGQQAMRDMQETLRDQQDLSDETFQDLQGNQDGQPNEGQQPGQQGQQGQQQQPGQGQGQGQGQDPNGQQPDNRSLAERQQDLQRGLDQLGQRQLPGDGTPQGEAGRRALDEAGRAMEEAERALREGDLNGALDRQAEAMEAMRDGMRQFGEAMAQEQREQQGEAATGEQFGQNDPGGQIDPLGRDMNDAARIGSDRNMLQGEDVYRRAQDLLEEIRRRSGEQDRSGAERDYLQRLLDLF